jgi:hypothetical protein
MHIPPCCIALVLPPKAIHEPVTKIFPRQTGRPGDIAPDFTGGAAPWFGLLAWD